jgi:hypothetical protein
MTIRFFSCGVKVEPRRLTESDRGGAIRAGGVKMMKMPTTHRAAVPDRCRMRRRVGASLTLKGGGAGGANILTRVIVGLIRRSILLEASMEPGP